MYDVMTSGFLMTDASSIQDVTMVTGSCVTGVFSGMKNAMLCGPSVKRMRRHQLPLVSPPVTTTPPPAPRTPGQGPTGLRTPGVGAPLGEGGGGGSPLVSPHQGEIVQTRSVSCRQGACTAPPATSANPRNMGELTTSPTVAPTGRKLRTTGQLRLHVTCRGNQLTVHVLQARHLRSKRTPHCTSYVEISLVPGDQQAVYHTRTVPCSNQPTFDEKFTLEMRDEDEKRLRVAAYNKHDKDNRAELLGCMTFGVKHLKSSSSSRDVDGWYYLLKETTGNRKHLQVHAHNDKATKTTNLSVTSCSSKKSSASIPEVNRSLQGLDTLTVVVKRGRHGYGFTVMGSSPVTIGKVEDGSGAVSAGLRRGDKVVRINGQNVSRSTADSVAKIVKNSPKQIILDVVRSQLTSTTSVKSEGFPVAESFTSSNGYETMPCIYEGFPGQPCPSPASNCSSGSVFSRRTPMSGSTPGSVRRINDTLPLRPSQLDNTSYSGSRNRKSSHSSRDSVNSENNENVLSSRRSGTSSTSSRRSSRKSTKHASPEPKSTTAGYDSLRWDATNEEIFFPEQHGEIYDELPWKPFDCDVKKASAVKGSEDTYATMHDNYQVEDTYLDIAFTEADEDESNVTMADYAHTTLPEVSFCDLSRRERARQAAATQLVRAEAAFIAQMQHGIQRFSRPLRHCILSAQEHRVLFQNVEKLVAFSEYHMRQMANTSMAYSDVNTTCRDERYVELVGSVYRQRADILCEAYELYSQGLGAALQLLSDLTTYEQFHNFLSDPAPEGAESTLEEFLRKPVEHLTTLMVTLRTVLSHTSSGHRDASALERVVKAFSACCNKVSPTEETTTTASSNDNTSNNTSSSTSFASSRRSGSSSGSKSSTASIDPELVDIQERLVFPKHIPSFQLAIPARHVIYTSELLRVESCMWTKVVVILLSDLLLITRVDGDSLVVVDDPLPLPDVMNSAFGGSHPCEFTLTAEVQSGDNIGWEARHLLLRAPSMEQACTWKSLLEQRIASFRTHRELMAGRSREAVY